MKVFVILLVAFAIYSGAESRFAKPKNTIAYGDDDDDLGSDDDDSIDITSFILPPFPQYRPSPPARCDPCDLV